MKKIIAFTGHKLNGKTTASNYLMKRYIEESETPVKVERINMKDSIVEEMTRNLPGTLEFLQTVYAMTLEELFKKKPLGMRKLMQDYGLARRNDYEDYWVDQWEERVRRSTADVIITDDVRFLNELGAIDRVGGALYKIVRTGVENTDHHATEREIDEIECPVIEASNKEELFNQIDKVIP